MVSGAYGKVVPSILFFLLGVSHSYGIVVRPCAISLIALAYFRKVTVLHVALLLLLLQLYCFAIRPLVVLFVWHTEAK